VQLALQPEQFVLPDDTLIDVLLDGIEVDTVVVGVLGSVLILSSSFFSSLSDQSQIINQTIPLKR
jgi:hypothetical protein